MNFYENECRSSKQTGQGLSFLDILGKAARYRALPVFVSLTLLGGVFVPSPLYAQQDLTVDMSVDDISSGVDISIDSFSDDDGDLDTLGMEITETPDIDSGLPQMMADEEPFESSAVEEVGGYHNVSESMDEAPEDVLPMPTVVEQPNVPALPDFNSYSNKNMKQGAMPALPSFAKPYSRETVSEGITNPENIGMKEQRFYDSKLGQKRKSTQEVQIKKADPVTEPGSRFVVVHKQSSAKDFDAILVAAERALKLERYQAALEFYEQLHKKNPRDARVLMGRAVTLHKMGHVNSAILAYEELLEIDNDNPEAIVNLMGLVRGEYPSVALQRLLELKAKNPNNPSILAQIGITQSDIGNDVEAIKYLAMASILDPENPQHYFNIAVLSEKVKNYKQAVANYEKALEIDAVHGSGRQVSRDLIYDRLTHLRR